MLYELVKTICAPVPTQIDEGDVASFLLVIISLPRYTLWVVIYAVQ